jgi:hypothetical protein
VIEREEDASCRGCPRRQPQMRVGHDCAGGCGGKGARASSPVGAMDPPPRIRWIPRRHGCPPLVTLRRTERERAEVSRSGARRGCWSRSGVCIDGANMGGRRE